MNMLTNGTLVQKVRLVSGLILFAFVATHFLNHAVGLAGVEAMETVQSWRLVVTRSQPVSIILGLALLVHMALGLVRVARLRTLRMPPWEAAQIALGLAIPFLLFPHIVNTHLANSLFGVNDTYVYELLQLWPSKWPDQSALLLIVWAHSCIGLHYWLRLSPRYRRYQPFALALAVLIPFAALAGFMVAGQDVQAAAADPQVLNDMRVQTNWPQGEALDWLSWMTPLSYYVFYPFLIAVLLYMAGRWAASRLASNLAVSYVPQPKLRVVPGATLLEISRANGVPHMSVCGGRARCSTCRVEVLDGLESLAPAGAAEAETLQRIAAGPSIRLACQIRPSEPVTVRLLLRPGATVSMQRAEAQGVERSLAILFLDIRGFTNWSQSKLPYDIVHILNQTFTAAGNAVVNNRGWVDKYMGDGMMAVFGREDGTDAGCAHAIAAARDIDLVIEKLNRELADELGSELKVGMGIHMGPLVMGEIGHEASAAMTVIGRSVNTASRLEAMTKELDCQLIVSCEAIKRAGLEPKDFDIRVVEVRGIDGALEVVAFKRAREAPAE